MSVIIHSAITLGLQVVPVTIEAAIGAGFSGLQFLGLPNDYARDAKERIRASLESLGIPLPARRLLVSVRPSETLKQFKAGLEHLDLPCALAILVALADQQHPPRLTSGSLRLLSQQISRQQLYFAGQLTLSGELLPLESSLPFEILALQNQEKRAAFWCRMRAEKTTSHAAAQFHQVASLQECLKLLMYPHLNSSTHEKLTEVKALSEADRTLPARESASTAETQPSQAERIISTLSKFEQTPSVALALSIAAAGRHHILLAGSPGCGKTFSLRHLKNLLPPLSPQEKIETALIQNREPNEIRERSFRTPHHSASSAALLGGSLLQPGEVSLAHHGVLFLDEFAEFPRPTLEALREPLDERKISLSRARGRVELPANFLLLAATNPCACGYVFSRTVQCRCQVGAPLKYQQKLSGPLLERFSVLLLMDSLLHHHSGVGAEADEENQHIMRRVSEEWSAAVRNQPEAWAEHFIAVQTTLWQKAKPVTLSSEMQELILERSSRYNWSTRKRLRITEVFSTCLSLFTGSFSLNLNFYELLNLVEELRTLETTLQQGVYLLTPGHPLPLLKKNLQRHDSSTSRGIV
ncbi:MAG: ATP-binding protein [Betaproteobacteria bacterium]|nr:ATP-binding protein [Betaproteobacteria bacterium]